MKILIALFSLLVVLSCQVEGEPSYSSNESISSDNQDSYSKFMSSSAAGVSSDSSRKFIRTSQMKFRVLDVQKSTIQIENAVAHFDGFVTNTNLRSNIQFREHTEVSADSTLETVHYIVQNNMTLRVPNALLDTTIRTIAKQIEFLDYRIIKAEDVTLTLQSNDLAEKRSKEYQKGVKKAGVQSSSPNTTIILSDANFSNSSSSNGNSSLSKEERLNQIREQRDNTKLSTLNIEDRINYSTVDLEFYQRKTIHRRLWPRIENISEYRPGFWTQVGSAVKTGGSYFLSFLIGFSKFWPLWLILVVLGVGYKRFWSK